MIAHDNYNVFCIFVCCPCICIASFTQVHDLVEMASALQQNGIKKSIILSFMLHLSSKPHRNQFGLIRVQWPDLQLEINNGRKYPHPGTLQMQHINCSSLERTLKTYCKCLLIIFMIIFQ